MMRTASEKLAIIGLVEDSELSVRRTLEEIKVSRTSFYRWYAAYEKGGMDGLANQGRASRCHWNRIPDSVRSMVVDVALDRPELTPRELAWHITDSHEYFVSESSVYRILKAHDLITSPQFTVMQAADNSSTRPAGHMNCGRPILPISKWWAGAGTSCQRFWMITPATSSPGA